MDSSNLENCVFCNFDDSYILESNDNAFAAYFDCAIRPGHIVVALKDHVVSLSDLSTAQASDLMTLAARVAKKAEQLSAIEKYYLVSIADQTPHYHIHLLPKKTGDTPLGPSVMGDQGWKGDVGESVSEASIKDFVASYRSHA